MLNLNWRNLRLFFVPIAFGGCMTGDEKIHMYVPMRTTAETSSKIFKIAHTARQKGCLTGCTRRPLKNT